MFYSCKWFEKSTNLNTHDFLKNMFCRKKDIMLWCHSGKLLLPLLWDFGMHYAIHTSHSWQSQEQPISKQFDNLYKKTGSRNRIIFLKVYL